MLKRLLNLTLAPKRCHPLIQTRFFTVVDSKDDVPRHSDDIVDDIEQFEHKISIKDNLPKPGVVTSLLVDKLNCSKETAQELLEQHEEHITLLTLSELTHQLKMFVDLGIDKDILLKYREIIVMNPKEVEAKLITLKELPALVPDSKLIDFWPLMKMSVEQLRQVYKRIFNEHKYIPKGSRIHYFSDRLSIEPYVASALFSNYPFMYRLPKNMFLSNMDAIMEYNIPSENILRDPWMFQYSTRQIKNRLTKAEKIKTSLMPWMVHCPPSRLDKSLQLTTEIKQTLDEMESKDLVEYVAKRLGYERSEMECYLSRFPQSLRTRPTKVKKILDFLLNEAGHTPSQIIRVPRVLCFGLDQMRNRYEELRSLNYRINSLMVYALTRKTYSAFVERIRNHRHKLIRNKSSES